MKYMFISDVHGYVEGLEKAIEIFNYIGADKLILLGDTSGGYYDDSDERIAKMLNDMKDKVELIRGNCDSPQFEKMLEMEMFDDDMLFIKRKKVENVDDFKLLNGENIETKSFEEWYDEESTDKGLISKSYIVVSFAHGHRYNYRRLPPNCGDVFIQGHTHIPLLVEGDGRIYANPGSVSKPRGAELRCYLLVDEDSIRLITLDGQFINEIRFDSLQGPLKEPNT